MKQYCYDVEVFKNFWSAVFIDTSTPRKAIEEYCKADYTHDIELKNEILTKIIKPIIFVITPNHNDLSLFMNFMINHKILVGYNNINYDDIIIDWLSINYRSFNIKGYNRDKKHINELLYQLSYNIINYGSGYRFTEKDLKYYRKPYYSIDLQKLLYLDKLFISLKQVAVQLRWYRLEDLPLPYNAEVSTNNIPNILDYNVNDGLITNELLFNQQTEVNLRNSISNLYNVNVRTESRSGVANKLMMSFYKSKTDLEYKSFKDERTYRRFISYSDIISNKIKFNTPEFSNFLKNLKTKGILVGADTLKETVLFDGKGYTVATGGLHSKDYPNIYTSTDEYVYRDADVGSFYPRIILNEKVSPKHLNKDIFLSILEMVTDERLSAKTLTKKLKALPKDAEDIDKYVELYNNKADALKIVVNATYGKLGDENSFLYDLKAMYTVTINGQLYLLMLIERLAQIGIKCVSANTDGIICKVPKNKEDEYYRVCKQWEEDTGFDLEYTDYEKYVCYAVNDYMAIKKGYSNTDKSLEAQKEYIKSKGLFVTTTQIDKGYNKPIVAKALVQYYANGTDVKEFIYNHKDIYDFCISIKTGQDFIKEEHSIIFGELTVIELQKNVRYYISNSNSVIMKKYRQPKVDKRGVKRLYISLHKGFNSTVFNNFIYREDIKKYDINYNYYISEVYKIIHAIANIIHRKQSRQSYGGLFEGVE